ncbi:MAG TPA: ribonuclease PH [Planctomycetota bacterium]|nr:ribonuclease PH [Planctomycetota bacterium]
MPRPSGRAPDALREIRFRRGFAGAAVGSCLVEAGRTRVICTVSAEEGVPSWMKGRGVGWLTAEYAMLPGSTRQRKARDGRRTAGVDGRSQEIQRLIGRTLRAVTDPAAFPDLTLWVDCDVLEADGGTRCASVNGAWVALKDAEEALRRAGRCARPFVRSGAAAVSVGVSGDQVLLDLDYVEDSAADADMNVVMNGDGRFLEVQAAAERRPFTGDELRVALRLAEDGVARILAAQRAATEGPPA